MNRYGPLLEHVLTSIDADQDARLRLMTQYLKDPSSCDMFIMQNYRGKMIYGNSDQMVDEFCKPAGYKMCMIVSNSVVYEVVTPDLIAHLLRVNLPESILCSIKGRRLGDIVSDMGKMSNFWSPDDLISGFMRIKNEHYLLIPIETKNFDDGSDA